MSKEYRIILNKPKGFTGQSSTLTTTEDSLKVAAEMIAKQHEGEWFRLIGERTFSVYEVPKDPTKPVGEPIRKCTATLERDFNPSPIPKITCLDTASKSHSR